MSLPYKIKNERNEARFLEIVEGALPFFLKIINRILHLLHLYFGVLYYSL